MSDDFDVSDVTWTTASGSNGTVAKWVWWVERARKPRWLWFGILRRFGVNPYKAVPVHAGEHTDE